MKTADVINPHPAEASRSSISARLLPGVPVVESPLFAASIDAMALTDVERDIAVQLHARGYAVLDFPDDGLDGRISRIKANLGPRYPVDVDRPEQFGQHDNLRIQDAWRFDDDVQAIAASPAILALLTKLYGRRAFPFQTLNFPVGTQQASHSDSVHFSSQPERFMCGVWLAMEDIVVGSGPLLYYPGSHRWPVLSNAMVGRRGWISGGGSAQDPFEPVWRAMVAADGVAPETFLARKGQALIWAANLLHGGSPRTDIRRTRWSQVTHYYFADCLYYTPAFSDEALGRLDLRTVTNIATGEIEPNRLLGEEVQSRVKQPASAIGSAWRRFFTAKAAPDSRLPTDFTTDRYLALNPDVADAGHDATDHYLAHGMQEGRRYR